MAPITPARAAPGAAKLLPALAVARSGPELVTLVPDGVLAGTVTGVVALE